MEDKVCKVCGTTLKQFYKTGMLGCEHCYVEFKDEIELALKKIQGKTYHAGKSPAPSEDRELLADYRRMIKEKENATIKGDFSCVAYLTDEITTLYDELTKRGLL